MPRDILVLDDDAHALQGLRLALSDEFEVHPFSDVKSAESFLERQTVPLAVLDLHLPEQTGIEVLRKWKERFPDLEVIFCSAESSVNKAMECIRLGASDYIQKPYKKEDLLLMVNRTLEKQMLRASANKWGGLTQPHPVECIGKSAAMQEVCEKIKTLKGQTHLNVLILGESGTGKEVIARLLHQQEAYDRPFIVANMAAIPTTLMESELFGVEKGAFTDAKRSRPGKFELADEGDIFLDEIGDLPVDTQAKILRTLQEKQVERVGSQRLQRVHFRAISATNRPMAELVSSQRFREDLLYRLSDMVIQLPALRDRKEDIPDLAAHFLKKYRPDRSMRLSERALKQLTEYHWPGNIRELESTIKRSIVFCSSDEIDHIEIFRLTDSASPIQSTDQDYETMVVAFERKLLSDTLKRFDGDCSAAMKALRLPRSTFYRKVSQLEVH